LANLGQGGDGQKLGLGKVGDHKRQPVGGHLAQGVRGVAALRHDALVENEALTGEVPGCVVVSDGEPSALHPVIGRRRV
jgi:hypothetical protein